MFYIFAPALYMADVARCGPFRLFPASQSGDSAKELAILLLSGVLDIIRVLWSRITRNACGTAGWGLQKDRDLDEKLSSESPDRAENFNRRADSKREKYSRDNYYESVEGHESEKKSREEW